MNKKYGLLTKIAVVVSTILFGFMICATVITVENRTAINNYLQVKTYEIVEPESAENPDTEYFKSRYDSLADLIADGKKAAQTVEAEGAVLLKNDNNALPLKVGAGENKISLVGISSVDPAYGGRGSAQTTSPQQPVTPKAGFEQAGFEVNSALNDFYSASSSRVYRRAGRGAGAKINDAPWTAVMENVGESSLTEYGDAAVFIMTRVGGEGTDSAVTGTDGEDGNYLKLNDNEKSILTGLKGLKEQNKVKKIIVLLNTTNQIETGFLSDGRYGVDAAIWIGTVGISGFNAVGDIVAGKVNPGGHLSDTYWFDHSKNPTTANYGAFGYAGAEAYDLPKIGKVVDPKFYHYVVYQEGIYVGYRYTETRYFDTVMKTNANVGSFDYKGTVSHPFGYGDSYTDFEYSDFAVTDKDADTVEISVKVKNIGNEYAGKDVVQIYVQKPFKDEGANTLEVAAVELVGFAKTRELAVGSGAEAEQTLTVTVKKKDLAVYDNRADGEYVLRDGDYIFTAATDAHNAVNNILAFKGKTESDGMDGKGNTALVQSLSFETVKFTESAGKSEINNKFDFADANKYFGGSENSVKYVSRTNWQGTLPSGAVSLKMTDKLFDDIMRQEDPKNIAADSTPYPAYGKKTDLKLVHLREDENGKIPYDDKRWDELLDSLTWNDTLTLLNTGLRTTMEIPEIIKPSTVEHNGPTGLTEIYGNNPDGKAARVNDPDKDKTPPYYPCIGILASSFDTDMAAMFGDMLGEDAVWSGYGGLYGIGLNTHRTPYGGRLYEYFGEDPLLSGTMAAAEVAALQSHGCNAYVKHFVLNDQETNRTGIGVWINEQALREIYLKPFDLAVTEGGAMNVMVAFNRMGAVHCPGSKELLTDYLRGELGLKGFAVTDMYGIGYKEQNMPAFMMAGCDLPDGEIAKVNPYKQFKKEHGEMAWQMREAAHRILYATVHSIAMNGISPEAQLIRIVPGWQVAVITLDCLFGAMFAASVTGAVLIYLKERKKSSVKNQE